LKILRNLLEKISSKNFHIKIFAKKPKIKNKNKIKNITELERERERERENKSL
jgi:hypothetical protein